jgi:hypothetical protein
VTKQSSKRPSSKLKPSRQIYDESISIQRQVDERQPRQSEDDQQREQLGPRGVPGKADPGENGATKKEKDSWRC